MGKTIGMGSRGGQETCGFRDSRAALGLAQESLERAWTEVSLPGERIPALLDEVWEASKDAEALALARSAVGQILGQPAAQLAYQAARAARQDRFAQLLEPLVEPCVVDFGAGGTGLLDALAALLPDGSEMLATDIAPIAVVPNAPVRAVQQPDAAVIPLASGTARTVVATGVLHHIGYGLQAAVANELRRITADGGRLVLIEECLPAGGDVDTYLRLATPDAEAFLAFTDWWGNRVMKADDLMPIPNAFRLATDWARLLGNAGYREVTIEYLGLGSMGGHMETPRTLMVFDAA